MRSLVSMLLLAAFTTTGWQTGFNGERIDVSPRLVAVDGVVLLSDPSGVNFDEVGPLFVAGVDSLGIFLVSLEPFDGATSCGLASSFWLTCTISGSSLIVDSANDIVSRKTIVYGRLYPASSDPVGKVMITVQPLTFADFFSSRE